MNRFASIVIALTTPCLAVSAASAQDYDDYGPASRTGLTFGVGLGGGNLGCSGDGCDDFTGSGSFGAHIGGMMSEGLAGVFDLWWMVHSDDQLTVDQGIMTGSVRFWPVNHFWMQGGLGVARAGYSYDIGPADIEEHTEWVPAFQVGLGVEPIATDTFGLDIALRYGTGFYSDGEQRIHSGALTIGASFY